MIQREEFSSGKHVSRRFDADGRLASETHTYGAVDIGLIIDYVAGENARETYIIKNQLASRKHYEQARTQFPDMPPANAATVDTFQELSAAMAQERRDRRKASRTREPNPEKASQIDDFCRALIGRGTRANAFEWLEEKSNTLGELSHRASKGLVARLQQIGCRQIHACDITTYDQLGSNTGHLVVELPDEAGARAAVLRQVDRLARNRDFQAILTTANTMPTLNSTKDRVAPPGLRHLSLRYPQLALGALIYRRLRRLVYA